VQIGLLITDGYGSKGGIALYNRSLINCLCEMPQTERVVAFTLLCPEGEVVSPTKLGYYFRRGRGKVGYLLLLMQHFKKLKGCSLLICGHINLLPLSSLIARVFGLPLLLIVHGAEAWEKPARWKGDWMWRAIRRVICVSEVTRDRLVSWAKVDPQRITVIHNGIDLTPFTPGPKPVHLLDRYGISGKKVILTVGRLDPDERAKGFDQILDVLPRLLQKHSDLVYLIAGAGGDLQRLREKAQLNGIEERVIFAGWVDESEKADHYRLADAYVMPSRLEGFGYVFIEAMACGIPVVGSKIDGGRSALLDGELGELVNPDDAGELIAAIEAALHKGKSVPTRLAYFSIERFNDEVSQLVTQLAR